MEVTGSGATNTYVLIRKNGYVWISLAGEKILTTSQGTVGKNVHVTKYYIIERQINVESDF